MAKQTCILVTYEFKHNPPLKYHDAFKVVAYEKNGKGTIVRGQLSHQFEHKKMLFSHFRENISQVENAVIKFKALRFLSSNSD